MYVLSRGAAAFALVALLATGCDSEASKKTETTVTGPGGQTTVTTETKVEKSGTNPPSATP
jgi:hypothetical protein